MKPTNWDRYYQRPYKTASITRRYSAAVLVNAMRRAAGRGCSILELGGANSCFIDRVISEMVPRRYDVIDNNRLGIDLLKTRYATDDRVTATVGNILDEEFGGRTTYDIVYSVGLVEHFNEADTARAIEAHFACLRAGGTAIITFPTPTWLYRSVRFLSERTNNWIFHDERPLLFGEVERTLKKHGAVQYARILWPLILTQYFTVTIKN